MTLKEIDFPEWVQQAHSSIVKYKQFVKAFYQNNGMLLTKEDMILKPISEIRKGYNLNILQPSSFGDTFSMFETDISIGLENDKVKLCDHGIEKRYNSVTSYISDEFQRDCNNLHPKLQSRFKQEFVVEMGFEPIKSSKDLAP